VLSSYYYLISLVGTMHRAPTLPFPDQVEDRFVCFLGYNHLYKIIKLRKKIIDARTQRMF